MALSHLRSKKALEDVLSKRTLAYENIQSILLKIESAESDLAVLSAYSSATASLKSLLNHPSLQRENVENTMDALQDALADQKEIEDIVAEGGKAAAGHDAMEDEIQDELKALEDEARREKEAEKAAHALREKHAQEAAASAKEAPTATDASEKLTALTVPAKNLEKLELKSEDKEAMLAS